MTSPVTVVPLTVAVVVVLAVWFTMSEFVVRSLALQNHPFGAVIPVVMVTVQVPVVPLWKLPADAPPTSVPLEQPEAVNFVPSEMNAGPKLANCLLTPVIPAVGVFPCPALD